MTGPPTADRVIAAIKSLPCIRRCGRTVTMVVTRKRDDRTRLYCTECTGDLLEVFEGVDIATVPIELAPLADLDRAADENRRRA